MLTDFFNSPEWLETAEIVKTQFLSAVWETLYVTVLSTALAIIIGLPLGVLLVAGEKGGASAAEARYAGAQRHNKPAPFGAFPYTDDFGFPADPSHNGNGRRNGGVHCSPDHCGLPLCGQTCGKQP